LTVDCCLSSCPRVSQAACECSEKEGPYPCGDNKHENMDNAGRDGVDHAGESRKGSGR